MYIFKIDGGANQAVKQASRAVLTMLLIKLKYTAFDKFIVR